MTTASRRSRSRKSSREDTHPASKTAASPATPRDPDGQARSLAERAAAGQFDGMDDAIANLSPEEAAMFVVLVQTALRKRRILLAGYIATLLVMVGGMLAAFYLYAHRQPGQFLGWVMLVPFALVGAVLFAFGRWARRL